MITITTFKAARSFADGTLNNNGMNLKVWLTYQADMLASYKIEYKREGTDTWLKMTSDLQWWYDGSFVSSAAVLSYDYAYNIRVTIETDDNIIIQTAYVPTGFVLLDFNASGKGLAIGKVSENPNVFEVGMDIIDRHGGRMANGVAFYEQGGTTDPDSTTEETFLTSISELGGMMFVKQIFYQDKTRYSNRTQIAYPYAIAAGSSISGHTRSNARRHYVSGMGWSSWIKEVVVIESGRTGIFDWKKFSDGTCEFFGKIPVTAYTVGTALGTWFKGDVVNTVTQYPYPFSMVEAPAVEVTFQTRNGVGGLAWTFSADADSAQRYLPQVYLIRPTSGSGIYGNINIIGKGRFV